MFVWKTVFANIHKQLKCFNYKHHDNYLQIMQNIHKCDLSLISLSYHYHIITLYMIIIDFLFEKI